MSKKKSGIIDSIVSYFGFNMQYDPLDIESVQDRSRLRHFVFYSLLFMIIGLALFSVQIFFFKNFQFIFYIPLLVTIFSCVNLFIFKYTGKINIHNTLLIVFIHLFGTIRIVASQSHDFLPLFILAFIPSTTFFLKGNRWGLFSLAICFLISLIQFQSGFHHEASNIKFYYSLISFLIFCTPAYISNNINIRLIKQTIITEKQSLSKEFMRRLLHEIMNPLNVAKGFCDLENEKKENNRNLKLITESLDEVEIVLTKMSIHCKKHDLCEVIEQNKHEVYIKKFLKD